MEQKPRSTGWFLGLPYMDGRGISITRPELLPDSVNGVGHIFSDEVMLAKNWRELLGQWWFKLADGGHLILWLPDCRHSDVTCEKITREDVLETYGIIKAWECVEDDMIDGHHFSVFKKIGDTQVYKPWRKSQKHCLVMRTGAIGDALMASSILPGLKEQGYDIDFYCHKNGVDAVSNDPHLQRVISTEPPQTPDGDLPGFWKAMSDRYDRVVNLTNSVEGALLCQPWRSEFFWPEDQRRRVFSGSYLKSTHDIAGVPGPYKVKFYETPEEKEWAETTAKEMGTFALWCLRGSAVHKWYPWTAQAICQVLVKHPTIKIVLSGDEGCKPLEGAILDAAKEYLGADYMTRFRSMVGTGSVRKPMALAKLAGVVVGPETGVLNAVSLESVKKVCMLSHSSPSNLTDDWLNVVAIESKGCAVSKGPCHQLHHSHANCPQDQMTGAATCAAAVGPNELAQAVLSQL